VDFIQRGTWNLDGIAQKASPDWTKSTEACEIGKKAILGWTKSTEAKPGIESRNWQNRVAEAFRRREKRGFAGFPANLIPANLK